MKRNSYNISLNPSHKDLHQLQELKVCPSFSITQCVEWSSKVLSEICYIKKEMKNIWNRKVVGWKGTPPIFLWIIHTNQVVLPQSHKLKVCPSSSIFLAQQDAWSSKALSIIRYKFKFNMANIWNRKGLGGWKQILTIDLWIIHKKVLLPQ